MNTSDQLSTVQIGPALADMALIEIKRLNTENDLLRALLADWYGMFSPFRKNGTEGADIIDKTRRALMQRVDYK